MNLIKNKGITLIALVITIIILLILAVISIVGLRNTDLFYKTKIARDTYNEIAIEEKNTISGYKYNVDEYTDGASTINKLRGNSYLRLELTTEDHVTVTITAYKIENSDIDLSGYRIIMTTMGKDETLDENTQWTETDHVEVSQPDTMVYAALYDGVKFGPTVSQLVTSADLDIVPPSNTKPDVAVVNNKMDITVKQDDGENGSGIDPDEMYYRVGTTEGGGEWTKMDDTTITTPELTEDSYYVQTKVKDKAGQETESEPVQQKMYNGERTTVNGKEVATEQGGLYQTPYYYYSVTTSTPESYTYSCNCSNYSYSCNCSSYTYSCNCTTSSYSCNCTTTTVTCDPSSCSHCRSVSLYNPGDHSLIVGQDGCAGSCATCSRRTCSTCSSESCSTCTGQSCSSCTGRSCSTCNGTRYNDVTNYYYGTSYSGNLIKTYYIK